MQFKISQISRSEILEVSKNEIDQKNPRACRWIDQRLQSDASMDFVYVASQINKDIPSYIIFDRIWEKLPKKIQAEKFVESGSISQAILRVAKDRGSDMIVMGSRGLGLFKGALMGSVSQKVVAKSEIPVMVIK